MFQASINDTIIAEANTRTESAAQVAHEAREGRLYDPETGAKVTIDDCDVVEIAAFAAQVKKAYNKLGLGAHSDMLDYCGNGGLRLDALEKFCQDGHTEDYELAELAEALESAGANKAASICRNYIGL